MPRVVDDALRREVEDERTSRVRARKPFSDLEVDRVDAVGHERVEVLPTPGDVTLQHLKRALYRHPVGHTTLLGRPAIQRDRFQESVAAKSDVRKPLTPFARHRQHHVRAGTHQPACVLPNARFAGFGCEPNRPEREHEKAVLLEAVPAPSLPDHLGLQRIGIECHRPAHLDVEVFKRYGADVRSMQPGQRHKIRPYGSGVTKTFRILAKIERCHTRNDAPHNFRLQA
jgi:hypothetical protein